VRIPLSWLREFVELPESLTPEEVHESLVSVGLEEEAIHRFEVTGPVVVGEVLEFVDEPQTNGKTIRWCQVRVASADSADGPAVRGIVCGAHNFVVGDLVVVALPGSVLPGPFPITARNTYGHISDGMIASVKELGLGDDHTGILRLGTMGISVAPGTDAIELLGLGDVACEVNVTPDRGYALSIRGIAREYHHATGARFSDPAAALSPENGSGFSIAIADDAPIRGSVGCEVFIARTVRGVDPSAPTPAYMVARLALAGIRSISLPVDITNYVMVELGQPIHGYDLDRLTGGITVRRATAGETLTTLDGLERALHGEDLVIADDSGAIGLAGVMGGASTEISEGTRNVLVEAAWFDPVSIARTARRHKLPSEASKRFARGVDPLVAEAAAERVVGLLELHGGGTRDALGARIIASGAGVYPAIAMASDAVAALTGMVPSTEDTRRVLQDIGATLEETATGLSVTPPSWRPDLVDSPSLVEEVARILGYDTIPSLLPPAPAGRGLTRPQATKRRMSMSLAASGMTETLSYPFVPAGDNELFGSGEGGITIANALDSQVNQMRVSLIPGLLDTAARNSARGLTSVALYETGLVFHVGPGELGTSDIPSGIQRPADAVLDALRSSPGHQPWHVAGVFVGNAIERQPGQHARSYDASDALDAARVVARAAHATLDVVATAHPALHPGRSAHLLVDGTVVGYVGELLPRFARDRDLMGRVSLFWIDVDALLTRAGSEPHRATPLSAYPAATQDVSLVVDSAVPAAEVKQALREGCGELLESIHLVDDYRGEGIEAHQRSLTFALRFRATDRTLTQAEATQAKDQGVALAKSRFGAEIRA
jgi:phenylalanyl-tRNA synthetase beta chain